MHAARFTRRCWDLGLADLEHLGAAGWALALGCGSTILHCDLFRAGHLALGLALHAVGFHTFLPCGHLAFTGLQSHARNSTGRELECNWTLLQDFLLVSSSKATWAELEALKRLRINVRGALIQAKIAVNARLLK